ncbi:MAG: hypothetical protein U0525_01515 [Patescibacteria group bacterium]
MLKNIIQAAVSFSLLVIAMTGNLLAAENNTYKIKLEPAEQRYMIKSDFDNLETRFQITNTGEDIVYKIGTENTPKSLIVKYLYLNNDQIWQAVTSPMILKQKESRFITQLISNPYGALEQKDYVIDTTIEISSPYSPPPNSVRVITKPIIHKILTLTVNDTGYTSNKVKIAQFTTLNGPIQMTKTQTNLVLLAQNLDKYAANISGEIFVKNGNYENVIDLTNTTIEANNQTFLKQPYDKNYKIDISDRLKPGRNTITAKLKVNNASDYSVYSNLEIWVVQQWLIYFISIILIAFLSSIIIYKYIKTII